MYKLVTLVFFAPLFFFGQDTLSVHEVRERIFWMVQMENDTVNSSKCHFWYSNWSDQIEFVSEKGAIPVQFNNEIIDSFYFKNDIERISKIELRETYSKYYEKKIFDKRCEDKSDIKIFFLLTPIEGWGFLDSELEGSKNICIPVVSVESKNGKIDKKYSLFIFEWNEVFLTLKSNILIPI